MDLELFFAGTVAKFIIKNSCLFLLNSNSKPGIGSIGFVGEAAAYFLRSTPIKALSLIRRPARE
jgi:hypothetical protein